MMENSYIKSLTGQVQTLLKTNKDFPQKLRQRLALDSNNVKNPFQFIVGLFTVGVLSDGSSDPEGSRGLKETMVELAMMITCSKGSDAIGGLMKALEDSGNQQFISGLRTWVKHDFGVENDTAQSSCSESTGRAPVLLPRSSEKLGKNMKSSHAVSSGGAKFLARKRIEEESKAVRPSLFDRAPISNELSNLGSFKSLQRSATKGTIGVQFDKSRMMACSTDGTLNLWKWRGYENAIQVAGNVNKITSFQYDDEILVLGTAEGTVHLFDMRKFEEKWSVSVHEAVISLKFIESTLVVITGRVDTYSYWCVDISRPDMRLLNQRSTSRWLGCKDQLPRVLLDPHNSFLYTCDMVYVYETKSGDWIRDDNKRACNLLAPAVISTLNLGNLICRKSVVVAGCIDGRIALWNSSKLMHDQSPVQTFWGNFQPIASLCFLNGHLLSLDKRGKLIMWSGHDLGSSIKPARRVLIDTSNFTNLASHERWFASFSSTDNVIDMWTVPDLWLRTG